MELKKSYATKTFSVVCILLLVLQVVHSSNLARHKVSKRPKRGICINFVECMAMGISIINPRYITNLQGLHDRAVDHHEEYKEDYEKQAELGKKTIENFKNKNRLRIKLHELEMRSKRQRIAKLKREIAQFNARLKKPDQE